LLYKFAMTLMRYSKAADGACVLITHDGQAKPGEAGLAILNACNNPFSHYPLRCGCSSVNSVLASEAYSHSGGMR